MTISLCITFVTACGNNDFSEGNNTANVPVAKVWHPAAAIDAAAGNARAPRIAFDSAGNAIAVWHQYEGARSDIWANHFTAGSGWGTAVRIETTDLGSAQTPQIAVDNAGNAIAVWQQAEVARTDIWANRFSGGAWGTAVRLENDNNGDASAPRIAMDGAGNALAVWLQSDGSRANVMASRFAGGTWTAPVAIETAEGTASAPALAVDAAGNALAVWSQAAGTAVGARTDIWANRFSGGNWATAVRVDGDDAGSTYEPQVAIDPAGNAIAVWAQYDLTRDNIWASRFTPSGGWGVATRIETDNTGNASAAQIALDDNGNAWAVWRQHDSIRDNIWANRFTPASGWGTATPIEADNTGDALAPQIAVGVAGAFAVWIQSDGASYNVWFNRYTDGAWTAPALLEAAAGNAQDPQIRIDAAGNALAAWAQSDGARYDIWTRRYE